MMQSTETDIELAEANILLLGPTGCGKTLLAQTLARILNVPFAIADATALTEAGYVGEESRHPAEADPGRRTTTSRRPRPGIIYIDEVDKIAARPTTRRSRATVSGEGVQQALLKILEGHHRLGAAPGRAQAPHQEFLSIDTTNVLFICGGAFGQLDTVIERRIGHKGIGFSAEIHVKADHDKARSSRSACPRTCQLRLIPEFIGRLPVMSACISSRARTSSRS